MKRQMDSMQPLEQVGRVISKLNLMGIQLILIGGMALVTLGSRRVTRDFDFVTSPLKDKLIEVVNVFFEEGFELVSKLNESGDVLSTINNQNIACIRLQTDLPESCYFYNVKTGLKIDLLFDFPLSANTLLKEAHTQKVNKYSFVIASKKHLLKLKQIAQKARQKPGDAEDIKFLKQLIKNNTH